MLQISAGGAKKPAAKKVTPTADYSAFNSQANVKALNAQNTASEQKNGAWAGLDDVLGGVLYGMGGVNSNALLQGLGQAVASGNNGTGRSGVQPTVGYDPSKSFYGGGNIQLDALNAKANRVNQEQAAQAAAQHKVDLAPSDPLYDAVMRDLKGNGGATSGNFTGKLSDYIAQFKKLLPSVDYSALENNVGKQAQNSQKNIGAMYGGLKDYTAGLGKTIANDGKVANQQYNNDAKAASGLVNSGYDSGRQSLAQALKSSGNGGAMANLLVHGDETSQHQRAVTDAIAGKMQNFQASNTANQTADQAANTAYGIAGQQAGVTAQQDVLKNRDAAVAGYQTKASEQNAANALQALGMGTTQFNADRTNALTMRQLADTESQNQWAKDFAAYQNETQVNSAAAQFQYKQQQDALTNARADEALKLTGMKNKQLTTGQGNVVATLEKQYGSDTAGLAKAIAAAQAAGLLPR